MHKIRVIIPNLQLKNHKFDIPKGANINLSIFTYDLHDHFHVLKSSTRLGQLHLALILTKIHNGVRHQKLKLTPL